MNVYECSWDEANFSQQRPAYMVQFNRDLTK